jgi:type III restriction enzyme
VTAKDRDEARKYSFDLIMKSKEKLLSLDNKVSFIFAHSAIREGWDNPNVFIICLLKKPIYKTSGQQDSRRQELGRGLRICVNQQGERVNDDGVNILTVVCPENFGDYVKNLQNEYIESGEVNPPPAPSPYKGKVYRKDGIYKNEDFRLFWDKLCTRTSYSINIESSALVKECVREFNDNAVFPETKIVVTKGKYNFYRYTFSLVEAKPGYYARLRVIITDLNGKNREKTAVLKLQETFTRDFLEKYPDIKKKDFTLVNIDDSGEAITFSSSEVLEKGIPFSFDGAPIEKIDQTYKQQSQTAYPVFDFVSRTASATSLTRPTILQIFSAIRDEQKAHILINPEGFTSVFIHTIKEILADHIAAKIEYALNETFAVGTIPSRKVKKQPAFDGIDTAAEEPGLFAADSGSIPKQEKLDIEDYFPPVVKFPQRELIEGSGHSLYTEIQIDSNVEKNFVEKRLKVEDQQGKIICYFKFPAKFKIYIPKILGNYYNPDWGVIRQDTSGGIKVQLVRETKGAENLENLQHSNEGRKVKCGKKHFSAIGVRYRHITDKTIDWYTE